jgi:hypothetical protein
MNDIQALVDAFVLDTEVLIRRQALASVQAALGVVPSGSAGKSTKGGKTKPSAPSAEVPFGAPRARRSPQELAAEANRLLVAIKAQPGSTIEQLKVATKVTSPEIPIKSLLAAKRIKKSGLKRATRYFVG